MYQTKNSVPISKSLNDFNDAEGQMMYHPGLILSCVSSYIPASLIVKELFRSKWILADKVFWTLRYPQMRTYLLNCMQSFEKRSD